LPLLSRQIREGKQKEASHSQNRAIELSLFLSLPAAAALTVIAAPVITVMFERGAFGPAETRATWHALVAFAVGLPAFVLAKLIAPSFYANHDTKTPFKIALVCIVVNLAFNLLLMVPLRHVGMALATSIAGWVNVLLMVRILKKRAWLVVERRLVVQLAKIIGCCLIMMVALMGLSDLVAPYFLHGEIVRFAALCILCASGLATYLLAAFLLNVSGAQVRVRHYFSKE
jgi:putative peptidoglycan lipid II flippase